MKVDNNLQSSEKTVNQVAKQRVQSVVEKTKFVINKREQKRARPKCIHTNKGEPRE